MTSLSTSLYRVTFFYFLIFLGTAFPIVLLTFQSVFLSRPKRIPPLVLIYVEKVYRNNFYYNSLRWSTMNNGSTWQWLSFTYSRPLHQGEHVEKRVFVWSSSSLVLCKESVFGYGGGGNGWYFLAFFILSSKRIKENSSSNPYGQINSIVTPSTQQSHSLENIQHVKSPCQFKPLHSSHV